MPTARSGQWWTVNTPDAASNARSGNGSASAKPRSSRAVRSRRWATIAGDGSSTMTVRSPGS